MANKAFLHTDDFIYLVFDGDQDGATVQDMVAQTEPLIQQLVAAKKPVCMMIDLSTIERVSLRGRQVGGKALLEWPYVRMAVFGANTYMRHVVNLMLLATEKGDKVRLFPTEAEAKQWLQEKQ